MSTNSSHRVIMGKTLLPIFLGCFSSDLFILTGKKDTHDISAMFEIHTDSITDCRVSCP